VHVWWMENSVFFFIFHNLKTFFSPRHATDMTLNWCLLTTTWLLKTIA
jgi:hypothetical protein